MEISVSDQKVDKQCIYKDKSSARMLEADSCFYTVKRPFNCVSFINLNFTQNVLLKEFVKNPSIQLTLSSIIA